MNLLFIVASCEETQFVYNRAGSQCFSVFWTSNTTSVYAMQSCGQTDGVLIALDTNQKIDFVTEYIRNNCKYAKRSVRYLKNFPTWYFCPSDKHFPTHQICHIIDHYLKTWIFLFNACKVTCRAFWKYSKTCEINTKVIAILHMHEKILYNGCVFKIPVLPIDFKIVCQCIYNRKRDVYHCGLSISPNKKKLQKLHKWKKYYQNMIEDSP